MERKPKVSVIMPCYNHEKYVAEAIESVLAQTYQDFEFIVCNNGSTDNCGEIINRYRDRVQIITLEKNDQGKCSQLLREAAKGEFLAGIASDDYWYPDKLEEQMKAVEQHPEYNIFFTWTEMTGGDLQEVIDRELFAQRNRSRYQWIHDMIEQGTLTDFSSLLIRNDGRYTKYTDTSARFLQLPDFVTYLNMVLEENIYIVEKFLVKHRNHGENVSTITNQEAQIRSLNERGYILHEIWERLSDEEFTEVFLGKRDVMETKEDIMCHRILLYMNFAKKNPGSESYAMAYAWDHYYDKGISELLDEKYGFTLQDLYQYETEAGEGKYWYILNQQERDSVKMNVVAQVVSCNNKILAYADNQDLRKELLKLASAALDNLQKIGIENALLQPCVEKQIILEKSETKDDAWFEFIDELFQLNENLKTMFGF